jgi:hypothetical protein
MAGKDRKQAHPIQRGDCHAGEFGELGSAGWLGMFCRGEMGGSRRQSSGIAIDNWFLTVYHSVSWLKHRHFVEWLHARFAFHYLL